MGSSAESFVKLSIPTDRTGGCPKLTLDDHRAAVAYDYEHDDGAIVWSTIHFEEVLLLQYRANACNDEFDVLDSTQMRVSRDSQLLKAILSRWQDFVGSHEHQQRLGGSARFQHFTIFFDDGGCVDVIASSALEAPSTA